MNKLIIAFFLSISPLLAMDESNDESTYHVKIKEFLKDKERECVSIISDIKLQFQNTPSVFPTKTSDFYQEIMQDLELEAHSWKSSQVTIPPYIKDKNKNELLKMGILYGSYLERFEEICNADQCMYKTLERDIFSHYGLKVNTIIKGIYILGGFSTTLSGE